MKKQRNDYSAHKKAIVVGVAILLTASVSGYFMGLRQIASVVSHSRLPEAAPQIDPEEAEMAFWRIPMAVDYSLLPHSNHRPNVEWQNHLDTLDSVPDAPPTTPPTEAERAQARGARSVNRAYEGAPPTIPHPIEQISSASCLACHGEGARVKDRIATKISHPHWSNCTQCHAPASAPLDSTLNWALAGNTFSGSEPPGPGARAYEGAPPQIPHTTWMRNDCASCHGPKGLPALRTTHPERPNCMQCHAPSAELDQRQFASPDLIQWLTQPGAGGGG
jgi:nitrate reductase (cytochrome), electron transfer subunit